MNSRTNPSTAKEALIAELLGDFDTLLARSEALPTVLKKAEESLLASVIALDEGGDRYRLAVTQFNEEAKQEIKAALVLNVAKSLDTLKASMQEAAVEIFTTEGINQTKSLNSSIEKLLFELRKFKKTHFMSMAIVSISSSILTSFAMYMLLKPM